MRTDRPTFTRAQRDHAQRVARNDLLASLNRRDSLASALETYNHCRTSPFLLALASLTATWEDVAILIVGPVAAWRCWLVYSGFAESVSRFIV
jgi:hypothetical protein